MLPDLQRGLGMSGCIRAADRSAARLLRPARCRDAVAVPVHPPLRAYVGRPGPAASGPLSYDVGGHGATRSWRARQWRSRSRDLQPKCQSKGLTYVATQHAICARTELRERQAPRPGDYLSADMLRSITSDVSAMGHRGHVQHRRQTDRPTRPDPAHLRPTRAFTPESPVILGDPLSQPGIVPPAATAVSADSSVEPATSSRKDGGRGNAWSEQV